MGDKNIDKKEINNNTLCNSNSSSQKKANKIHLELLSLTKEEINKREKFINKNFTISKKENMVKVKNKNEDDKFEQIQNHINKSDSSDTEDSVTDSSNMSSCEEETII